MDGGGLFLAEGCFLSGLETKEFFMAQNLGTEEPLTVMSEQILVGSGLSGAPRAWGRAQEQE